MIVTLQLALIIYLILLFTIGLFGLIKTISLYGYGGTLSAFTATAIFWGASAFVLLVTFIALSGTNWAEPLLDISGFFSPI